MTSFNTGDIILVPFPFTNQKTNKKRPAVVISSQNYNIERPDLIIMAVTSQIKPTPIIGDVMIQVGKMQAYSNLQLLNLLLRPLRKSWLFN